MRGIAMAASAALLLAFVPPAHADDPGEGLGCGFSSVTNQLSPSNRQAAYIDGGPFFINDGTDLRVGRITCTVRIDTWTHAGGTPLVSVSSLTTPGVVYLPPRLVEYDAPPNRLVMFCSQIEIDGVGTFYWDDNANDWSTDPDVVCHNFLGDPPPGWDLLFDTLEEVVDPLVCSVLGSLAPGVEPLVTITQEGDTSLAGELVWSCPPYEVP